MKVLVTGGGGFLGKAICKQLVAGGHSVRALNRHSYPELDALGVEQCVGDLRELDTVSRAVEGCDAVIHTAAKAGAWGPLVEYYEINVRGTDNILAACEIHRVNKLVYTSSPSVVHNGPDLNGVNESVPYATHFLAHYPQTKAMAEQRVLAANSPALATVALRPHLIWGPGDPHLLPRILDRVKKGRLRFIGDTPKKIDTVYVDNAAEAHVLALQRLEPGSPIAGKVYFITQGEPITTEAMVNSLLKAAGLPAESRRISLDFARFLGRNLERIWKLLRLRSEPPLTRFIVEQLASAHWFNIASARRDLGYAPRVSTNEGLARVSEHLARARMSQRKG
ncbi:NAD-dependent epimerase/dehydratase family protein [Tahibacter amnicola]|uniref:NAD-dependent epimerase/dehydratase family protein n=1 Tax=Tahibacter amnicola TaxID=2976241 RepID=A0ABY6BFT4_9GAMM|nr:NAD-dependent epimerase/dehydratase family protein [Tahibacter amnicola]UXI68377.1 NAD-dependent epimerase/dehydratase family protein [Tahibacter amnicola]